MNSSRRAPNGLPLEKKAAGWLFPPGEPWPAGTGAGRTRSCRWPSTESPYACAGGPGPASGGAGAPAGWCGYFLTVSLAWLDSELE